MRIQKGDHVVDFLDAYLNELLMADDAEYVSQHVAECEICRLAMEEARRRQRLIVDSIQDDEACTSAGQASADRVVSAVDRQVERAQTTVHRRQRRRRRLFTVVGSITATAALILVSFTIYYSTLTASPYALQIMGQDQWLADSQVSIRVAAINQITGQPLAGIPIMLSLLDRSTGESRELASFETDKHGSAEPAIDLPDWSSTGDYTLVARADMPDGRQQTSQPIRMQRNWRLSISTDKPVYKPGQTIHIRMLALRGDTLRPVAGREVELRVIDSRGNVIMRHREPTSRYGIVSMDCRLADEILHGQYRIEAVIDDTRSETTVEVMRYVLPKFKITAETDRKFYMPGDRVEITVDTQYFFGKPVAGGRIDLEVTANVAGPETLLKAQETTDEDGKATIHWSLFNRFVGLPQAGGDAPIDFTLTVTDQAGQTETKSFTRLVTTRPIRVDMVAEDGTIQPGVDTRVFVLTTYPDGRPAAARVIVTGRDSEIETDEQGLAVLNLSAEDIRQIKKGGNTFELSGRAIDSEGQSAEYRCQFGVNYQYSCNFVLRTDRSVYKGGESIEIEVDGPPASCEPIFLDVLREGRTILTKTIDTDADGRGYLTLDLPPELFGTLDLAAYRIDRSTSVPVARHRIVQVERGDELRISIETDQQTYKPGDEAQLTVRLTDVDGKPFVGAASLAVVDEAVFSVLSQNAGLNPTLMTIDRELLQPVYAIYPESSLWMLGGLDSDDAEPAVPEMEPVDEESRPDEEGGERIARVRDTFFVIAGALRTLAAAPINAAVLPGREPFIAGEMAIDMATDAAPSVASYLSNTYWENQSRAALVSRQGLEGCAVGWWIFGSSIAACFCVWLLNILVWRNRKALLKGVESGVGSVFLFIVIIGILFALLMPAGQSARESGRLTSQRFFADESPTTVAEPMANMTRTREDREFKFRQEQAGEGAVAAPPTRVRRWFPETLLWRPEVVTGEDGVATIAIPLADSITQWRVTASAVTTSGMVGGTDGAIHVFQPFFVDLDLPVALTRGDQVELPLVVYNYLDKPQKVMLDVESSDWYESLSETRFELTLEPGAVRSARLPIKALKCGDHKLLVRAQGETFADAVEREVTVDPDGRRVEQVVCGSLASPASIDLTVPAEVIERSVTTVVRFYPSTLSQVIEGLDTIFQRPYGCFEQTSSTTYPNVLALDYMQRNSKALPEVELKAREYIHLGYQRLISFECNGGGFDWFGRSPGKQNLTAYGLMEFVDMSQVYDVDPALIARTREWLEARQESDGGWPVDGNRMHDEPTAGDRLSGSAYVAWSILAGDSSSVCRDHAIRFLTSHKPSSIDNPHTLALVCNALLAAGAKKEARPYVEQLADQVVREPAGRGLSGWRSYWKPAEGSRTTFYGGGRSAAVETTALAVLALAAEGGHNSEIREATAWIIEQKDGSGGWQSTQATVLALKALLAGSGEPDAKPRKLQWQIGDEPAESIEIGVDQNDVMVQRDLSDRFEPGTTFDLKLEELTDTAIGYQVTHVYYVPDDSSDEPTAAEPLKIDITYERNELQQGDILPVTARVECVQLDEAPMVILDLPVPPGFAPLPSDFQTLVDEGKIAKFQVTPRAVIVYLRNLRRYDPLKLDYNLRATMPVEVTARAAKVYEYYDPDRKAASKPQKLTVVE